MVRVIAIAVAICAGMLTLGCNDGGNGSNEPSVNQWPRIGLDQYGRIVNPQNMCPKLSSTIANFNVHDSEYIICEKQQHNAQIACDQNECGQWACGFGPGTTAGNACIQRCDQRYYNAMIANCTGKDQRAR